MELALTRSANIYTNKYTYTYITPKSDNSMIGRISVLFSSI